MHSRWRDIKRVLREFREEFNGPERVEQENEICKVKSELKRKGLIIESDIE